MRHLLGSNAGAEGLNEFIDGLMNILNDLISPVLMIIAVGGIFFAIYLAWRLAAAEDDGKRKEAKKQLMWTIIAIIALFGFIALFAILRGVFEDMDFTSFFQPFTR